MSRRRQRRRHQPIEVRELVFGGRVLVLLTFDRRGVMCAVGDEDSTGADRERAAAWLCDELPHLTHDQAYNLLWR